MLHGLEYSTRAGVNSEIFAVKKHRRTRVNTRIGNGKIASPEKQRRVKTNEERWAELVELTRRMERNGINRVNNN